MLISNVLKHTVHDSDVGFSATICDVLTSDVVSCVIDESLVVFVFKCLLLFIHNHTFAKVTMPECRVGYRDACSSVLPKIGNNTVNDILTIYLIIRIVSKGNIQSVVHFAYDQFESQGVAL